MFDQIVAIRTMARLMAVLLFVLSPVTRSEVELIPIPASVQLSEGRYELPGKLIYGADISQNKWLSEAVKRLVQRLEIVDLVLTDDTNPEIQPNLSIELASDDNFYPFLGVDESYGLTIDGNGISIRAANTFGAFHALTTLDQLFEDSGPSASGSFPYVEIIDEPRFGWRGMLVDVVRHWMPIETLRQTVDYMAYTKLNVLHLHLTDDQGFRIECKIYPRLQSEQHYTQAQMKDLVAYAAARGIRIVPEFGLPGHSTSWQEAYPQLSVTDGEHGRGLQSIMFSKPIDVADEATYKFIDNLVQEMAAIFPDKYWHIGGDEVNTNVWASSPSVQSFMQQNDLISVEDLQPYFTNRYIQIVASKGKTAIGWDEIEHPSLPESAVLHAWREHNVLNPSAHKVLVSVGFYLDQHYSSERMYTSDLYRMLPDDGQATERVIGGEIANWSESIDGHTIAIRTWPRSGAVAELFWSPAAVVESQSPRELHRRLSRLSLALERMGSQHIRYSQQKIASLAAGGNAAALLELASVTEPQPFHFIQNMLSLSFAKDLFVAWWNDELDNIRSSSIVIDELAEFLPPESEVAVQFRFKVEDMLDGKADSSEVREMLERWSENEAELQDTIDANAILASRGIKDLSAGLTQLSGVGLTCLDAWKEGVEIDGRSRSDIQNVIDDYSYIFDLTELSDESTGLWSTFRELPKLGLRMHRLAIRPGISLICDAVGV